MLNNIKNLNSKSSSLRKSTQKGYSLYHLNAMNSKLESQQIQAKKLVQRMKQQRNISQQVGKIVGEQILKVQNDGTYFASRLQQQKRKHQALLALVSRYQELIYSQKKQKQEELMKTRVIVNKYSTRYSNAFVSGQQKATKHKQNQEQDHILKQLDKDYEQLILKNNTSEYELSKKLDQVRTLRSQRTVFNKVFDQFQQEIWNHQFMYKQLVIQRYAKDYYFQNKIKQFQQYQIQAEKSYQKIIKNQLKRIETERVQFLQQFSTRRDFQNISYTNKQNEQITQQIGQYFEIEEKQSKRVPQTNRSTNKLQILSKEQRFSLGQANQFQAKVKSPHQGNNKKSNFKQTSHSPHKHGHTRSQNSKLKENQNKQQQQTQKIKFQRKVRDIFNDLNIGCFQQIETLTQNLDGSIQNLYRQAQVLYQKIYQQQLYLKKRGIDNQKQNSNYGFSTVKISRSMQEELKSRQKLLQNIAKYTAWYEKLSKQLYNFINVQLTDVQVCIEMGKQGNKANNQDLSREEWNKQEIVCKLSKIQQIISQLLPKSQNISKIQCQPLEIAEEIQISNSFEITNRNKRDTNKTITSQIKQQQFMLNTLNTFRSPKGDKITTIYSKQSKQKIKQDQFDQSRLQQILKDNKTTHNNMSIYTEDQLIQIYNHIKAGPMLSSFKKSSQTSTTA